MLNDPTVMLIDTVYGCIKYRWFFYNTIEQRLSVYVSVLLTLYHVISSLY